MSITSVVNLLSPVYMVGKTAWNVYKTYKRPSVETETSSLEGFRPSVWSQYSGDQLIYLAPNIAETKKEKSAAGKEEDKVVGYYFDAFVREDHLGAVRITDHPVQGGTHISDHAYNLPDTLTIDILVSDVVQSIMDGQFAAGESKSISAYEVLRDIKERRVLVSARTRLHFYENMLIESMSTADDFKNLYALRCTVRLRQILMAVVAKETVKVEYKPIVSKTSLGDVPPQNNTSILKEIEDFKLGVSNSWWKRVIKEAIQGGQSELGYLRGQIGR